MSTTYNEKIEDMLSDPARKKAAFSIVVKQYSETLYWKIRRIVLNHEDASDVLQNVFLKAWSNLDDFQNKSQVSTWLYRIAVNESLDFLRRQKNQIVTSTDDASQSVSQTLMADRYFDGDDTEALLQEAIAQLPDVQRTVFNLRYFDEMKYSDISEMLHTSEGALKASYHIAVKKISEFFKARD